MICYCVQRLSIVVNIHLLSKALQPRTEITTANYGHRPCQTQPMGTRERDDDGERRARKDRKRSRDERDHGKKKRKHKHKHKRERHARSSGSDSDGDDAPAVDYPV